MAWVQRQSPRDCAPTRLLIGAGAAGLVVVAFLATAVPPERSGWRLAVLAVGVGAFALVTRDAVAALATACLAWPTLLGFLVDRYGELHWHGSVDLVRAGVLLGAALGGTALGWARSALHTRRPRRPGRPGRRGRSESLQRSAREPAQEEWKPIDG